MGDGPELPPVFTVGYGSRSLDELIELLQAHGIECVVDVRTSPYSRFRPEFGKQALETTLPARGLRYVFLGRELGGRPEDPDCYRSDGKVDYDLLAEQPAFQRGIDRVCRAREQATRLSLLCSEGKPEECHRSKLIGAVLARHGIPVVHLDEGGSPCSQQEVIARETHGQLDLFGDPSFTSRKRYREEEPEG